ncbi:MAG TPA: phosphopentomutase [Acholeplasmataceae bacterium]|nr:phosphopentomutase [Acholeplasmataceae bacterium]
MEKYKRIFIIVADSLGVGSDEMSHIYNDQGANTFKHLSYSKQDFSIPTLESLGVGNITDINNTKPIKDAKASYGKMRELSIGKDTLTGHWEFMGIESKTSFPSFTETGFPKELIHEIETQTGYKVIGNKSASGTEILVELGEQQKRDKSIIVYTSADSVLQIAAHEETIPVKELYRICSIVRKITLDNPKWKVGRIIARPYIGKCKTCFERTANRHDYAVTPPKKTVLNYLKDAQLDVIAIGKIKDIYDGEGITQSIKTTSNIHGMNVTKEFANKDFKGICFVNLVEFDSKFGHRRNPVGYAEAVEEFDRELKELITLLKDNDLLMIVADHGNDPTHFGTDHTREFVPLLVYNNKENGKNLGIRETFADIGATISENFSLKKPDIGNSFLKEL